ncbi:MAG: hypothetical protein M3Z56_09475 [Bacteroidota bacterium]|nr:hypothetical protein [Bacteroidota bacterium]
MADKERISQPSQGSNELGADTNDTHLDSHISAGSDTQLHIAAKGKKKNKKNKNNVNDDELTVKNNDSEGFLKADETDE